MIASTIREIARALNGDVIAGDQVLAPGPHHGRKDRSLSIRLSATAPLGFLVYSFAGQDWQDCQTYVTERLGLDPGAWKSDARPKAETRPQLAAPAAPPEDDSERIAAAVALWRSSIDPRGTLVERYPLVRNTMTGRPQAVSRTFLDREGKKLKRMFLGPTGGAVMLDPFDSVLGSLHIGEGTETCMAARVLGLRPTWALGSAGAVGAFPILGGIECLTLLQETDAASERAVEQCAARWSDAGREVFINESTIGSDLNDALKEIKHG